MGLIIFFNFLTYLTIVQGRFGFFWKSIKGQRHAPQSWHFFRDRGNDQISYGV